MAYDNSNEVRETLLEVELSRGDLIKVDLITKGGTKKSFDIRRWYTDDEGEVRPTQKGVRIGDDTIVDVVKSIVNSMTEEQLVDLSGVLSDDVRETLGFDSDYGSCEEED